MRYTVTVAGQAFEVEIDADGVRLDGRPVSAELHSFNGSGGGRLAMDGVVRYLAMSPGDRSWTVQMRGESWQAQILDERARRLMEVAEIGGGGGGEVVRAPMPGMVLRVEVTEGQAVTPGSGIVVLEAMKMENEIRASREGVVTRVLVTPGAPVEKGVPLVEIGAPS